MFTWIQNGIVYDPSPRGIGSVLFGGEKILHVGSLSGVPASLSGWGCEVVDATGCLVIPGLVDPHSHLLGAGGERGFSSRQPEVSWEELVSSGVTTVVGCLGTDTITRNLRSLLGRVRQLKEQGLSAYMYTGGFPVPPPTMTGSIGEDMVLVEEVIGLGEIAIADVRSAHPTVLELARLVSEARVAGKMAGKAGVTHFHVGPAPQGLSLLHRLLEQEMVEAGALYATHVNRDRLLIKDAALLGQRGAYVDMDTVQEGIGVHFLSYVEAGGFLDQLTFSSDAHTIGAYTQQLWQECVRAVRTYQIPLETVLPCVTKNTARVLHLPNKGVLQKGADADVLILSASTLEVIHVFAKGKPLMFHRQLQRKEFAS